MQELCDGPVVLIVHSRAQTWYLSVRKSNRRGVVHTYVFHLKTLNTKVCIWCT